MLQVYIQIYRKKKASRPYAMHMTHSTRQHPLYQHGILEKCWDLYYKKTPSNRPFPSSKKSHFQSEAKCEAIDMKMIFNYDANKTHFHNKGFALRLVLKVRFFGTRKWPI